MNHRAKSFYRFQFILPTGIKLNMTNCMYDVD